MSEKNIQTGIQTAIRAMSEFDDADVVINDWRILDQSSLKSPYVIIENSDDWQSQQDTKCPVNTWNLPITIIVRFIEWSTSLDALRDARQAIVDKINSDTVRSAGGLSATNVRLVRADGPIAQIYDRYIEERYEQEAMPIFLSQRIILEVEEF